MSHQIAVSISEETTALVTYRYPKPFIIQYSDYYRRPPGYVTVIDGIEYKFDDIEATKAFFQKKLPSVSVRPAISNILLLKPSYPQQAVCIHGIDLISIQRELDQLPEKKYSDVEELVNDCLPQYDY